MFNFTKLTRRVAFGAALLAGVASFASSANAAASTNTAPTFGAGFQAPLVNSAPTFASNLNARFRFAVTAGTAANSDGLELFALFYNSSNAYVGLSRAGAPLSTDTNPASATKQLTVGLAAPASATQVVFIAVARGDETAEATPANADDTLGGFAANRAVLVIVPGGTTRTGATASFIDVGAGAAFTTAYATGATPAQIDTIANLGAVNSVTNRVALSTTYNGPLLVSATKASGATPADMRVTFNAALAALSDNTNVNATVRPQNGTTNSAGTNALVKGALSAGGTSFKIDDNNAALVNSPDNVDILAGSSNVLDEAGNSAAAVTNFSPVTVYAAPAFASAGTGKVLLTGGTAVSDLTERNEFNSTTGTGNNGETFIFTVRMQEAFDGTGVDNVDDIALTPAAADALTTVSASGANASTFGITVTLNAEAQAIRVNSTSGILEFTADDTANPIVWTPVTFGLTVGAGALTTADGGALTVASSTVNLYNTLASTPTVSTLDSLNGTTAGVDGILDGVQVDFVEDVGTLNATGFSIFDRVTPATTATPTVAASATDASIINASVAQATLYGAACNAGFLEATQTCATNANTASDNATPIPYDFSLSNATSTYARVYNATTGNLQTLPNIAAGGTISDGAAPVVVKVARQLGEAADPEGSLVMTFSEGLSVNPAIGFVRTQNGSLALDVLNDIDDGGAASATATRSQLSVTVGGNVYNVANNTATFADVDNSVLSALTSVGVTAGNSGGNGFRDATGNFSGSHVITPDATTTITTVAPSFDRAVTVVSASRMVTNVLVFLTENVTLTGTNLNERFTLVFGGATVTPSAAAVTGNIVNLTLPGNGVALRQIEGTTPTVAYTSTGNTNLRDTDSNLLATFGAQDIRIPRNSDELFSMEIRGTVTTDGTVAVAQGTIVRADLVRAAQQRLVERATATVPCNCPGTGNQKDVSLTGLAGLDTAIYNGLARGATSIPVYINVTHVSNQATTNSGGTGVQAALFTTAQNPSGNVTEYVGSLNLASGAITSTGTSVSGQIFFREGPIQLVDAVDGDTTFNNDSYAVVNGTTGTFRLNVGTNSAPLTGGEQFVIISVRRNGTTTASWVPVTFADKSLAGYLPFNGDVKVSTTTGQSDTPFIDFQNVGGNNGTVTAAFRLDRILSVDLADTTNYQLVGTSGQIARTTGTGNDFNAYRFFTTINTDTGAPYSLWGANNEAFTLITNGVKSAFELGNFTIDNIKSAWGSMFGIAYRDAANRIVVTNRDTLFYPVTANTATAINAPAGWHLITVQAAQAAPGSLGNGTTDNTAVGMIIEAGARRNGDGAGAVRSEVRTWIRGASENSLTALEAGKAYFVYLNAADATFTGN